jgi:flagellar assembly factor FliW
MLVESFPLCLCASVANSVALFMPTIKLQNTEITFVEGDIITFEEGLVGLPHLRQLVIVSQPEIEPFLWLASAEEPETAFLVLEPHTQFDAYAPQVPPEVRARLGLAEAEQPLWLAIVKIAPEWQHSTINLKAPLVVAPQAMRGAQFVLTEHGYRLDELLAA